MTTTAIPDGLQDRNMEISRLIPAPIDLVWSVWSDPDCLPQWWGPDGYSCRTDRIDLHEGGEWVFDMIGPDGTRYPNHHCYSRFSSSQIDYTLYWGKNGPKHADASVQFDDRGKSTRVTLRMTFVTAEECENAKSFGAVELGQQTLGKLEKFALSRSE